ncbi:MAG: sulfite exporter TauE/SafE family protein [Flavobacteriales bacterium]|nr:sulfite exporter TauE/SafE family protein [Flavobacteriales bacterium]
MNPVLLLLSLAVIALLFASVGHGGASGYLALMALLGYSQDVMRPSALVMNLFVSGISFVQFARARHFHWSTFWPFAITSVPAAYLGAQVELDPILYRRLLAICLLFAVARLMGLSGKAGPSDRQVVMPLALVAGALLGFVSGMIGIGGGILLSPLLLLLRWADAKRTAAVSALFILVNSLSGLIGLGVQGATFEQDVIPWVIAVVLGGAMGGYIGSMRMSEPRLKQVLGFLLLLASIKLLLP